LQVHPGGTDHQADDVRDLVLVDRCAGHRRARPVLAGLLLAGPLLAASGLTWFSRASFSLAGFGRVTLASWHHDLLVHDLRDWDLAYPGLSRGADRTGRPAW